MNINLDIPGWMTPEELAIIAKIAELTPNNSLIIELGSYCGRSSWAWQFNMPQSVKLDLVDVWYDWRYDGIEKNISLAHGSDENKKKLLELIYANEDGSGPLHAINQFLPEDDRVTKCRGDVMDYNIHTTPSVVFIDAEHTFDAVDADIARYKQYHECLLIGHDFASYALPVVRAVVKNVDRRTLFVPRNCSIWMLIPTEGYWTNAIKTIIGDMF